MKVNPFWVDIGAGIVLSGMMLLLSHWLEVSVGKATTFLIVGYGIAFVTREVRDEVTRSDASPGLR